MRILEAAKAFYRRHRRATLVVGIVAAAVVFFAGYWTWGIFGHYPARKAARLDPIEALRYE